LKVRRHIIQNITFFTGLGPTVPELGIEEFGIKPVEKTQFSMVLPEIMETLKNTNDQVSILLRQTHQNIPSAKVLL
jgi:hypothetical protein